MKTKRMKNQNRKRIEALEVLVVRLADIVDGLTQQMTGKVPGYQFPYSARLEVDRYLAEARSQ
jgi:hypothetical protein